MKKQDSSGIRVYPEADFKQKSPGPGSAGQSGDTQGLSDLEEVSSESVRELVEDGQFFEAEVVSGIEDAPDGEVEVHSRKERASDVSPEYLERDEPSSRF
jgi:hypothetical protein